MDEHLSTSSSGTRCRFALFRIAMSRSAPVNDGEGLPMCDISCTTRCSPAASESSAPSPLLCALSWVDAALSIRSRTGWCNLCESLLRVVARITLILEIAVPSDYLTDGRAFSSPFNSFHLRSTVHRCDRIQKTGSFAKKYSCENIAGFPIRNRTTSRNRNCRRLTCDCARHGAVSQHSKSQAAFTNFTARLHP
jgi:hypothetical protein